MSLYRENVLELIWELWVMNNGFGSEWLVLDDFAHVLGFDNAAVCDVYFTLRILWEVI